MVNPMNLGDMANVGARFARGENPGLSHQQAYQIGLKGAMDAILGPVVPGSAARSVVPTMTVGPVTDAIQMPSGNPIVRSINHYPGHDGTVMTGRPQVLTPLGWVKVNILEMPQNTRFTTVNRYDDLSTTIAGLPNSGYRPVADQMIFGELGGQPVRFNGHDEDLASVLPALRDAGIPHVVADGYASPLVAYASSPQQVTFLGTLFDAATRMRPVGPT